MGAMDLGVTCECGQCVPVAERNAGSKVTCPHCRRMVVVPLMEEFRGRPTLPSATTLERRIQRLIAGGLLPATDACLGCGAAGAPPVNLRLECERSSTQFSGGRRFIILPAPWGLVGASWREPVRVEVQGRDTNLYVLTPLCDACRRRLGAPALWWYLLPLAPLAALGAVVGYFGVGVGFAAVLLAGVGLLLLARRVSWGAWQRTVKGLLRKVPVYRQLLQKYPHAVVAVGGKAATQAAQGPPR
jgi:hypothetical protein